MKRFRGISLIKKYWAEVAAALCIFPVCTDAQTKKISRAVLEDKIYASWLGQMIGNIYGLPHENKYIERPGPDRFPYGYGANLKRIKKLNGAFSDDDTDIEYIYLLQMEKFGIEPTYAQLVKAWKYHIRQNVWLANRAALGLMHAGLTPPATGMKRFNPHWFQIDPQLVNEVWAVTAPGMTGYAVQKSLWAARITSDSFALEPTMFYAALYSNAFFEDDIYRLIDKAIENMPANTRFVNTVRDMQALYKQFSNDWKAARQIMCDKYYYQEPEYTRTIWNANLNGACGILALLYGGGDFQKTLDYSCAIGFDADNQAATMSGLIGLMKGMKGLPSSLLYMRGWKKPFNDIYKNVTRYDMPDAGIKDMAMRMVSIAEKVIVANGGYRQGNTYVINTAALYHAPLEFVKMPFPAVEINKPVDFDLAVSVDQPVVWKLISGQLPSGLKFTDGKLSGVTVQSGVFPLMISAASGGRTITAEVQLIVRPQNLAAFAWKILSNVPVVNVSVRDSMWLGFGRSAYANSVEAIRDGRTWGDTSVFLSIAEKTKKTKTDQYGYEWKNLQQFAMIGLNIGSMEENGGWFTSLHVQYMDSAGRWQNAKDQHITPALSPPEDIYIQPQFIEYLITIKPVSARAIRIIGDAALVDHWNAYSNSVSGFTSITELRVYPPFDGIEKINMNF